MEYLITIAVFIILLTLHESAHVLSGKVLGVPVSKIGFAMKPLPHPYVLARNVDKSWKAIVFLAAGFVSTLLLFTVAAFFNFWDNKFIYYAFCVEIIIETNPIYSDFVLINQKSSGKDEISDRDFLDQYINHQAHYFRSEYFFTPPWYLHLILWGGILIYLFTNTIYIQL